MFKARLVCATKRLSRNSGGKSYKKSQHLGDKEAEMVLSGGRLLAMNMIEV